MTKNVSNDEFRSAASKRSTRPPARVKNAVVTDNRERFADTHDVHHSHGRGLQKPREPLHARIVHFDVERSSGPLLSDNNED